MTVILCVKLYITTIPSLISLLYINITYLHENTMLLRKNGPEHSFHTSCNNRQCQKHIYTRSNVVVGRKSITQDRAH